MTLKLKLSILVCALTLVFPITHFLYSICNLEETENYSYLHYYSVLILISWLVVTPVLLKLLDSAAKQCARNQFKRENNDNDTI